MNCGNTTRCWLVAVDDSHDDIELPDGIPVSIGRSTSTNIADTQVSRLHVKLTADYEHQQVVMQHIGKKPSVTSSRQLLLGDTVCLGNGDAFWLLPEKYKHVIKFCDMNGSCGESATAVTGCKRRADDAGVSVGSSSKRHSSASATSDCDRCSSNVSDDQQDSDAEQVETVKQRLKQLQHTMDKASVSSHSADDVSYNKQSSVPGILTSQTCRDLPVQPLWLNEDSLLIHSPPCLRASDKIAGFDLDGTIITTKSGKAFATDVNDWKLLMPEIPSWLRRLVDDGFRIVFFSNQMGVSKGHVKVEDVKRKTEAVVAALSLPIQVLLSTQSDMYRKPAVGMWQHLVDKCNSGLTVDTKQCLYVGDAAGRPKDWAPGKKKDFSCGDRLFALNIGITFHTPEEFFRGHRRTTFSLPSFDPRNVDAATSLLTPRNSQLTSDSQEIILLVGCPASGKSHFAREHLVSKGYVHINQDSLKTWQKCVAATKEAVGKGLNVVVDNTNPDIESRRRYVDVAKASRIACRCFTMSTTLEHSKHNERFRQITDKSHQKISDMVFNVYKSKFVSPTLSEGFSEIVNVNFVPQFDKNSKFAVLYRHFLMEK